MGAATSQGRSSRSRGAVRASAAGPDEANQSASVALIAPPPLATATPDRIGEVVLARVIAVDEHGGATIRLDSSMPARAVRALAAGRLEADCIGRMAAVMFLGGDPSQPLIVGMIVQEAVANAAASGVPAKVTIDAAESIELRCGESTLTLQRNGRVVLRAKDISSYASGTQRINGAVVELN